ncbi:MAG TPA: T9SS type A sorting domain-containing protein [Bacteroidota bacterium]|nr:T9SS type A sorting domain-containing protein [Bacteroidota bacterium]
MRRTIAVLLALSLVRVANAQTVYQVTPDTKGNQIVLTVANESKTLDAQGLLVQLRRSNSAISFAQTSSLVKVVQAQKQTDVTFKFDVSRDAKLGSRDTLIFVVSDNTGSWWQKSIIISYAGPQVYKLEQNFPNPFNPSTMIYYDLPFDSHVKIMVYDILGREVRRLVDEEEPAGYQKIRFDVQGIASGTYFYRVQAEPARGGKTFTAVKKMLVLK